jgi:hypothetical protein
MKRAPIEVREGQLQVCSRSAGFEPALRVGKPLGAVLNLGCPKPTKSRRSGAALAVSLLLAGFSALAAEIFQPAAADQARGQEILRKFAEANRYWLQAPPPTVRNFSYVLNRLSGTQSFEVTDPAKTPRARVQGVSYNALLQQLARAPQSVTVTSLVEEGGKVRLFLSFKQELRCAIGNGVENSWNGYHSFRGREGSLVLDSQRWVPLEASVGRLQESFSDYVAVDPGHYVPLAIHEQLEESGYDWHFRLYAPGLWLFDESLSDGRRLAWVEQVKINAAEAAVLKATPESLARAERTQAGQERLQLFLKANRQWLLPSLMARRGFAYEYRQEAPYLERVLIDFEGNVMVRLEACQDSPNQPTRQRLWLADGRSYTGNASDSLPQLTPGTNLNANPDAWLQRDRMVQNLALGLGIDCALTRLAREPDNFQVEVRPLSDRPERYVLVLHGKRGTRLFTGTMLAFSSWAYMHDVDYDRAEVLCDATTHRPIEEKDFSGKAESKGEYFFENWLSTPVGPAPGLIRSVIPVSKDGKDGSLEMSAQFQLAKPGVWLLAQVASHFRGATGGSTGTVSVVLVNANTFQPIRELVQKAGETAGLLEALQQAPVGTNQQAVAPGEWKAMPLRAAWTEQARESARSMDDHGRKPAAAEPPLIGLHRGRILSPSGSGVRVELQGVSTANWKEYGTVWKVSLQDAAGHSLGSGSTNLSVRAEGGPTPFVVSLELPLASEAASSAPQRLAVEATVQRMSGMYHGHGMWLQYLDNK